MLIFDHRLIDSTIAIFDPRNYRNDLVHLRGNHGLALYFLGHTGESFHQSHEHHFLHCPFGYCLLLADFESVPESDFVPFDVLLPMVAHDLCSALCFDLCSGLCCFGLFLILFLDHGLDRHLRVWILEHPLV